jgi:hypothetical protein
VTIVATLAARDRERTALAMLWPKVLHREAIQVALDMESAEQMCEKLSDVLELIRRAGGSVVFEELPGDFEEDALRRMFGAGGERGIAGEPGERVANLPAEATGSQLRMSDSPLAAVGRGVPAQTIALQ